MKKTPIWRIPNRVAYIVSHSYPFSSNGYAVRTHGIARALVNKGSSVVVINRPGRPWDLDYFDIKNPLNYYEINGVKYLFNESPSLLSMGFDVWLKEATEKILQTLKIFKPSMVMAASNWENALPALHAANRLNIPFYYEVRGFWELSNISNDGVFKNSFLFDNAVVNENYVCNKADGVFTLNNLMKEELIKRGVDRDSIEIVGNALGVLEEFGDVKEYKIKKFTKYIVGYVGSFTKYENIDELIRACAHVRENGIDVSLLLVGSSTPMIVIDKNFKCEMTKNYVRLAKDLGFDEYLITPGRVNNEELKYIYEILDLVVIPRASLPVTEIVTPIKPYEAAGYGRPVLVSDVKPLLYFALESGAVTYQKNNEIDLVDKISELLTNDKKREDLGRSLKDWVYRNANFNNVVKPILKKLMFHNERVNQFEVIDEAIPYFDQIPVVLTTGKNKMSATEVDQFVNKMSNAFQIGGGNLLAKVVVNQTFGGSKKFSAFCHIKAARVCLKFGSLVLMRHHLEIALKNDSGISSLRGIAKTFFDAAYIDDALKVIKIINKKDAALTEADFKLIDEIESWGKILHEASLPSVFKGHLNSGNKIINILAFSLPYTSVGYSTRSHGLALGIKSHNWDIRPYTRPGFPYDFREDLDLNDLPTEDSIEGVVYHRLLGFGRKDFSEYLYMLKSVQLYMELFESEKPAVVHAASNYVTALPALIAAKNLGIPFVYEVRGFWEITRSSRDDRFEFSKKYLFMQLFERLTALNSDHVITITTAMKDELIKRGLPSENISIAYNSVNTDRFTPVEKNLQLANDIGLNLRWPVIGYIGSFVDYEGLDDLVEACLILKRRGFDFSLLLVGDGQVLEVLKNTIYASELAECSIVTGRVPFETVDEYYSLVDIAPFPRKPWEVCELVSPLKPYEAMALEKSVVVSNTRALIEIVRDQENGLVFRKGDVDDLAEKLRILILDEDLRKKLGENARKWVTAERNWNVAGDVCSSVYSKILNF